MNDIVIPSTAKQIQTQKILHAYRDRMLGENLLIKAIQPQETEQYLFDYLQFIQSKNEETLITGHVINTFNDDGSINYNPVNILATGSKQDNLQRQ